MMVFNERIWEAQLDKNICMGLRNAVCMWVEWHKRQKAELLFSVCLKNRMLTFDNMLNPRLELMFSVYNFTSVHDGLVFARWYKVLVCLFVVGVSTGSIMIVHVLCFWFRFSKFPGALAFWLQWFGWCLWCLILFYVFSFSLHIAALICISHGWIWLLLFILPCLTLLWLTHSFHFSWFELFICCLWMSILV